MVNKLLVVLIGLMFVSVFLSADSNVYVTADINQYSAYENQVLKGTITVTHDQNDKVDAASLLLDKKPLQVEFIKDVQITSSSPIVISYYNFQIPAQPAGLYVLPEVSVKVGGKQYRSVMSSYAVQGGAQPASAQPPPQQQGAPVAPVQPPAASSAAPAAPSQPSPAPAPAPAAAVLRLEAAVEGPKPLYPGEQVNFTYRYFYNTSIDLTKEQLPLLDAEGFLKIGDEVQKNSVQNGLTVSEVIQVAEAVKPGDYSFGPSVIEGYAYTPGAGGQHIFTSGKLTSQAPGLTVTVSPFPEKDKPVSFNGAIGEYKFNVALTSSPDIEVGDEVTLSLDITGKGRLGGVKLPEMCCQPGFSGFLLPSGLPPVGTIKGDTKNFIVRLRPLNDAVKEIPSIEFSSFDPASSKYIVQHSKPIPIVVKASRGLPVQNLDQPQRKSPAATGPAYRPQPIEIEGIFTLSASDLYNKWFGTWWVLAMIPFGIALLIYQVSLREYFEKMRKEAKLQTGSSLLQEALNEQKGSSRYFELINRALKLRLAEAGLIASPDIAAENLPTEGLPGEVRAFLLDVDERRFAGKGELLPEDVESKVQALFDKISGLVKGVPK